MSSFGKRNGGGRRSARREPAPLCAVFTTITRSHRAFVIDVSTTGVRLRGEDLPCAGEPLEISIEAVHSFGYVMWSDGGECGIEFDQPLSAADVTLLRHLVARMAGVPLQFKAALDDWMSGFAR